MNLIIFDIDGTLIKKNVDFEIMHWNLSMKNCFNISNISDECYEPDVDSEILRKIFLKYKNRLPTANETIRFKNKLEILYLNSIASNHSVFSEIEGASSVFSLLMSRKDCEIRLATGNWKNIAFLKLKTSKIFLYDKIDGAFAEDGYSREEILQLASSKHQKKIKNFEKIIYVADGHKDYFAAKNLLFDFIGMYNKKNEISLKEIGVNTIIYNFNNFNVLLNNFFLDKVMV